jgi:hypothetical protein
MHTTITVNGIGGMTFLSSLPTPLPRALEWLLHSDEASIDVDLDDAEQVAEFLDHVLHGWGWAGGPPLLFSPRIGDEISVVRDALLQIQTPRRAPKTWRFIACGTRGRLVARHDDVGRVVLLDGPAAQHVTFIRDHAMTKARHSGTLHR